MVMVMVMVICLGLYRSLPCYLGSSFGPVRLRRASNAGREEPSLARPHFVEMRGHTGRNTATGQQGAGEGDPEIMERTGR